MKSLEIISWGKRHGKVPKDFHAVDCTALRNPYLVPELKDLTGKDNKVREFVLKPLETNPDVYKNLLDYAHMLVDKRHHGKIAFICLGGRHRSVVAAEAFAKIRKAKGDKVNLTHMHINGVK